MDALTKSAWRAVVRMTASMAAALFLSAGSLRYWHAWLFLACFVGSTVWITAWLIRHDRGLLARRLEAGVGAEKEPRQKIIVALAGIFFVAELVLPALDFRNGHTPLGPAAVIAGNLLVLVAFTVVGRVYQVNSYTSATVQVEHDQRLISTGPYSCVRHPMYAGVGLCILGIPLALAHPSGYIAAVPLLVLLILRILAEERQLGSQLPGYIQYCQAVRYRLIPRIW
ncbi:MAG: isoprenylcysteine carboxylmethyltransferase family protein [Burkholderiaceae bacterium]|nr:isoprenylcysteine carboxylmethyltransferase family protein [Burkholderiaceae bacterium]